MPGFVADAVRVLAGEAELEAEFGGVLVQPSKCRRPGKVLVELNVLWRADVDGFTGMVFAETGGRYRAQDDLERNSRRDLFADNLGLAGDGAKT